MTTSFSMTLDIALVLISATAMFYCFQLNQRLRRLGGEKSGIASAVDRLDASVKAAQVASGAIATEVRGEIDTLNALLDRIGTERQSAEDILETLDGQVHAARTRVTNAMQGADEVAAQLARMSTRSEEQLRALAKGVEVLNRLNAARGAVRSAQTQPQTGTSPAEAQARVRALARQMADSHPPQEKRTGNPFMRAAS